MNGQDRKIRTVEIISGALAAAVPFIVYALTLPPTITFEDSGQLITAAAKLGISHPTGYPLAALVGHMFTLLPFGRMAWRVNAASAGAATACCFILFLLLRRLFLDYRPEARIAAAVTAAGTAIAFGLSRTFWSQAIVTEAYAVNALALAAVLYAAFNFIRTGDVPWGYLAAFLAGLALGAHTSSTIITIPVALYLIWRFRKLPGYRGAFAALAFILLGFAVYLYLPVRAVQGPALNWGDTRTLPAVYAHLTRRIYGGPSATRFQFFPLHLFELGKFLWWEFAPPAILATGSGIVLGLIRRAKPWGFLALLLLPTGPIATLALVLLLQGHQITGIQVWYIPFFMLSALFLGLSLFELTARAKPWARRLGYAALGTAVALPLALNFSWNDYREYYFAEDYAANFLRTIAYRGLNIMFERGSLGTFETAYLKKVEGYRPDHVFVDATGSVYSEYELFAAGRSNKEDPLAARRWERAFEQGILNSPEQREIYYSIHRGEVSEYGLWLEPAGMLFRVERKPPEFRPLSAVWKRYTFRGVAEVEADPTTPRYAAEEWIRDSLCKYKLMLAREYFLAGEEEQALATLEAAAPLAYDLTESLLEIAYVYLLHGYPEKAIPYFDSALEAFPRQGLGDPSFRYHYAQINVNKGIAYLHVGDVDAAEAALRESLEAYPDQPEVRRMLHREGLERAAASFAEIAPR